MVDAEDPPFNSVVVKETGHGKFQQEIVSGKTPAGSAQGLSRTIFSWRRLAPAPR